MAILDDLLPAFEDNPAFIKNSKENMKTSSTGTKRRAWLVNENEEYKNDNKYTKIIHKPDLAIKVKDDKNSLMEPINTVYKSLILSFEDLCSNPLQLFRLLYEIAKNSENYETPRIKLRDMMVQLNISKASARTALRVLLKKNFIERIEFQPGKLGWSRYRLNEKIYKELKDRILKGKSTHFSILNYKSIEKNNFHEENHEDQWEHEDPWEKVDLSPLESIGFNKKHLLQIKNKISIEVAQESINHFAYGLKFNKKIQEYSNPIATLIAVLKRGEAWVESNYKTPQELARIKLLEVKRAELERKKNLEEELYKVALEEWKQKLSKKEIESIAPDLRKKGNLTPPSAKLGIYFKEKIWPDIKNEYLI